MDTEFGGDIAQGALVVVVFAAEPVRFQAGEDLAGSSDGTGLRKGLADQRIGAELVPVLRTVIPVG